MALARYIGRKVAWTLVVFVVALLLNFLLPRLIPGNPVDAIVGQLALGGGAGGEQLQQVHEPARREPPGKGIGFRPVRGRGVQPAVHRKGKREPEHEMPGPYRSDQPGAPRCLPEPPPK